ncbi:HK97-gp10 family putative phage morphogenesis protein [Algiphilus sp.]|uniref:HK97-gp10 family putative phage morphogenesis protein n=1 Tax=Algiphilus sp. TaxID=1872431 RepID=UPI003CCBA7F8
MKVQLQGVKGLERYLEQLAPRAAERVMRNGVTDLARDGRDEMRRRAAKDEGILRKAINAKRRRGKRGEARAVVYVTHGKGVKFDAYYWHFIEYGTSGYSAGETRRDAKGKSHGTVRTNIPSRAAQPFARPTWDQMQGDIPTSFARHLERRIGREMGKIKKVKP